MRHKRESEQSQRELFQIDLEQLIGMSHPLVGLGLSIDWLSLEKTLGSTYHPSQGAVPRQNSIWAQIAPDPNRYEQRTRMLWISFGRKGGSAASRELQSSICRRSRYTSTFGGFQFRGS